MRGLLSKYDKATEFQSILINNAGCKFSGNLVLGGSFQKFSVTVNITDNLGTGVDLNETMHAMPMSTVNHKSKTMF